MKHAFGGMCIYGEGTVERIDGDVYDDDGKITIVPVRGDVSLERGVVSVPAPVDREHKMVLIEQLKSLLAERQEHYNKVYANFLKKKKVAEEQKVPLKPFFETSINESERVISVLLEHLVILESN